MLRPRPSALDNLKKADTQPDTVIDALRDLDRPREPDAPTAPLDGRSKNLEWVDKAKKWLPATWLTTKVPDAIGKGVGEAATDFYNLLNVVDDPTLGADPATGLPRKNFGAALLARKVAPMIKTDFDHFWDEDKLQVVRDMMAARKVYGEDSDAFRIASEKLSAQNKAFAESSLSMSVMKDYMSRYGSWDKFTETLYNRPDKILVDLADLWTPKLPAGIAMKLRRATPDNWLEVVDDVEKDLRDQASEQLRNVHPELLDNLSPKTLYHGSPEIEELLAEGNFSKRELGGRTNAASAKEGFFFTDNENVARSYAVDDELMASASAKDTIEELQDQKAEIGEWDKINSDKELWEEHLGNLDSSREEISKAQREVLNEKEALQAQIKTLESQYENAPESMLLDIDTQIDPLLEKLDDLDNEIADFGDELAEIDVEKEDVQSDIQGAEDNLKELEDLDEQIGGYEEDMENAIYEFQELPTVNVHLIMQNPMVFEQQFYNRSLAGTMRKAKREGYDGIIIKNMYDPYLAVDPNQDYVGTHYIVFEPGQIVNADTGLPMGDIPDAITMLNVMAGRQTEMRFFVPEGVEMPKRIIDAIEQNDKGSGHLTSFFAAFMLEAPVKTVGGDLVTPTHIVGYLKDMDNASMIEQLLEMKTLYSQDYDNVLEKYKGVLSQEHLDQL